MTSAAQNSKQVLAQKGTAATPAYTFLGNNNTGFYLSNTNEISIATNGTQRVVIGATGTVTIPTLNLTNQLGTSYGGTGLTGFTAANNAIYSTSSSALTAGTLPVAAGGTGQASALTQYGVIYGSSTTAMATTAAGTTGQVLVATTGGAPSWSSTIPTTAGVSSISFGTTGLTPNSATQGAVTVAGTLTVANGGTGQTSYTDGQLLIGNSTGNTLTKATLTAGSGVSITNGSGSITISATGSGGSVTSVGLGFSAGAANILSNTGTTSPITSSGTYTLAVTGTSGGIPYFSSSSAWTSSAVLAANALMIGGGAGAAPSTTTTGTGVLTALGNAVTGSGGIVLATSPSLTTPTLGVATATSINKVAITAPATSATLTIADGKTATVNNSITFSGTDSTTMTFPSSSATVAGLGTTQTFTGQNKFNNLIDVNNAVTVTSNAGTVPVTFRLNTFTNSSAANMTITMATASAVDGQMTIVRIYDATAVAKTITWVNTENSNVTAPTTSNGSTTLPLTVGFMYNSQTSKWRCIASA